MMNQHNVSPPSYEPMDDEISLFDLLDVLIRKKYLILGITVLVSLAALLYSLMLPRVYRAAIYFRPPTLNDISMLNAGALGFIEPAEGAGQLDDTVVLRGTQKILEIDPEKIYQDYLIHLQSRQIRFQVFEEVFADAGALEVEKKGTFEGLNAALVLYGKDAKIKNNAQEYLTLEGGEPEKIAAYLNILAEKANEYTVKTVIADLEMKKEIAQKNLKKTIENKLQTAKRVRQDEILRLTEQDLLQRNEILAQMDALRQKAKEERLLEIARLEEKDQIQRNEIREKIRVLLAQAEVRRKDKIKELEEAIVIARGAGIVDRTPLNTSLGLAAKQQSNIEIKAEVNPQRLPLYMFGEKTLEAEVTALKNRENDEYFIPQLRDLQKQLIELENNDAIDALKSRKDDDPYIAELPELQRKLKMLEENRLIVQLQSRQDDTPFVPEIRRLEEDIRRLDAVKYDKKMVKAVLVDQAAFPPISPIKPNRKKIVMLALVAGLMLGVFSSFIFAFVDSYAEQKKKGMNC